MLAFEDKSSAFLEGFKASFHDGSAISVASNSAGLNGFLTGKAYRHTFEMYVGISEDKIHEYWNHVDEANQSISELNKKYDTIILKDIEERQKRRESDPNRRKVTDLVLLKNISRFLAGSVGSPIAVKNIAAYITSGGRKVSDNTVSDYMEALVEPYIFYPVDRFDIVGKQLLKNTPKYYIVDLGIRRHLLPRRNYDLGFSLENVVYFELIRRGYQVNIGKVGNTEVDFVARKNERYHYFQVTASMTDEATFEREIRPLKAIADNYRKTILTLDRFTVGDYDGIEVANAVDWLLEEKD